MAFIYPTADTYLTEAGSTHGSSQVLAAGQIVPLSLPVRNRIVMRFDLSAYSAPFSRALLRLKIINAFFPDGPHDVYCYDLTTTAWVEQYASWTAASNVLNWTTAGGDFGGSPFYMGSVSASTTTLTLDLLSSANAHLGGQMNIFIRLPEGAGHNNHYFTCHSREADDEANWPSLELVTTACLATSDVVVSGLVSSDASVTRLATSDAAVTNITVTDSGCPA